MQLASWIHRLKTLAIRYSKYYLFGFVVVAVPFLPTWRSSEQIPLLPSDPYNPYQQQFIQVLEDTLQYLFESSRAPGAGIVVVKDSMPILMRGYGVRSVKEPDSVDIHTVFRLASVSKGFASALAGILVADTLLRWSDPVIDYVPSFALVSPDQTKKINLKHVLSHTTGLPYHAYTNLVEANLLRDDMIKLLAGVNLIGEAGQWYSYQNVAYGVVEPIVEAATIKSYQELLQERIFEPLRMNDASVWYKDMMETTNKALPHLHGRGGWVTIPISESYYNVPSAGGVNASSLDMVQWLTALLGNHPEVLPASALDSIFHPQINTPIENRYFRYWKNLEAAHYGLGWRILYNAGDTVAYHGGYANGYRSVVAVDRGNQIGICILSNAPSNLISRTIPIFLDLYRQYAPYIRAWEAQMEEEPLEIEIID